MAARDDKAHVVTEALHGIRQIKFSATERQWEQRILDARERELKSQWSVYVWAIFLTFTWIAMPALIGATALFVYAWQNQRIKASLSLTALSVFSSLEWTISAVPTTIAEMLDARVSTNRIHGHLRSEERLSVQKPGSSVELKTASIAWSSTSNAILRDLNLQFPVGALSVIHGKTGTGKSLLLAAIIGEANTLSGEIQVPQAPPMHMRGNEDALLEDWIIPSAFAMLDTVLVVAHRLSTVADFDKILVLSDGSLVEYDEPRVLAQRKDHFWETLKESGEDEARRHLLT